MKKGMWCKMPLELLKSDVALAVKVVYVYMLARAKFFDEQGLSYFESQEVIAKSTGLTRKTVNLSIQKMQEMQWLTCTKNEHKGNSYSVLDAFGVYS